MRNQLGHRVAEHFRADELEDLAGRYFPKGVDFLFLGAVQLLFTESKRMAHHFFDGIRKSDADVSVFTTQKIPRRVFAVLLFARNADEFG
jgi:hypothetical protein